MWLKYRKMKREYKALFAVTGTREQLKEFEDYLDEIEFIEAQSNTAGRELKLKWIVVYSDHFEDGSDCKPSYAYRFTNCKDTSKPAVITIKTAKQRLESGYYFRKGKYLNWTRRQLLKLK